MSELLLCRIEPDFIYPPFLARATEMLHELQVDRKVEFWAISGFRTEAEQMKLWCQGRTQPGGVVTNAKALQSAHNFGLALDFVKDGFLDRAGLQPDWRPESYEPLDRACRMHDLEWGGWWRGFIDRPHVQWPGYVTAVDLAPLAAIWKATPGADVDRLRAVWQYVDAHPLHP
jgi:peptidoglycan L-alanyl-D-glutamate endopeptidase CwlK